MTSAKFSGSLPRCAKFGARQRVAITREGADPNIGVVADVIAPSTDASSLTLISDAKQFSYRVKFTRPFSPGNNSAEAINAFVLNKLREGPFFRKILPPVPLDDDELDAALAAHPQLFGTLEHDASQEFFNVFSESELETPVLEQIVERYYGEIRT